MSETVRTGSHEVRRELHRAIEDADHGALEKLIRSHPGFVDAADENGRSPLMRAVEKGDKRAAEFLLDAGAAVNTQTQAGSALEVAVSRSDAALAELLLEHGGQDRRVAFRIARERRSRPIMEMIAHREPSLQLQMEFDSAIPDQKQIASEPMERRIEEPVLTLPDGPLHVTWEGSRNTYLEVSPGKPDRTFSVEVQQSLKLACAGKPLAGVIDGMWFSALRAGPVSGPTKDDQGRWLVRYAYHTTAGSYSQYSALDLVIDVAGGKLAITEAHDID